MTRWMMVVAAILAWGAAPLASAQPADSLPFAKSLEADSKLAAAKKIPILVIYTSPGCPFCERAKSEYLVPMLKDPAYKNKVIIREVDITSQTPLTLYNGTTSTGAAFAAQHKVAVVPTIKATPKTSTMARTARKILGFIGTSKRTASHLSSSLRLLERCQRSTCSR